MQLPTVAVLGLGAMGLPMATCLARDLIVRGFDILPARVELAQASGVVGCASAAEAVTGADAVLLVVRDHAQLTEVLFGSSGVVGHLQDGAVVILGSTIGTDGIVDIAEALAREGIDLVDAPLSGGPQRAGAGDLLIVVGAPPSVRAKVQPILDRLASTITVVGDKAGDGQALKTVNQLLCGVHIAVAAEALALADALGLDVDKAFDALNSGAGASFMLGHRGPRMLEAYGPEDVEVQSRLDIFVKDMGIVSRAAQQVKVPTPIAAAAEQLYLTGLAQGLGAKDDSSVIRVIAPARRGAAGTGAARRGQ